MGNDDVRNDTPQRGGLGFIWWAAALLLLYFSINLIANISFSYSDKSIAIKTHKETDMRVQFEIVNEYRELSGITYDIKCKTGGLYGKRYEISKEDFDQYIGEGNNTFRCEYAEVTIYLDDSKMKNDFSNAYYVTLTRWHMPWEEGGAFFREEEILELKELVMKYGPDADLTKLSFEYDNLSRGSDVNAKENGAIPWKEYTKPHEEIMDDVIIASEGA